MRLNFKMNKKAVSPIIAALFMIVLTIIIAGIAFTFINGLIENKVKDTESCFGKFQEVAINREFTCEDTTNNELKFFLNIGDTEPTGILVSIDGAASSQSFEIADGNSFNYLKKYNGVYGESLSAPIKNSGVTYVADLGVLGITDLKSMKIAPKIKGTQCELSDSLANIANCGLLS